MSKNCHHNASVACEVIAFSKIEDDRGHLSVLEGSEQIPFDVNRVFFVANPQSSRGNHAHKSLWELLIPIAGSLDVLVDDGFLQKKFNLKQELRATNSTSQLDTANKFLTRLHI